MESEHLPKVVRPFRRPSCPGHTGWWASACALLNPNKMKVGDCPLDLASLKPLGTQVKAFPAYVATVRVM